MPDTDNKMIFREKSQDKIGSPEPLNEYVKVASPGIWLVVIALLLLIIGILGWIILGSQFDPHTLIYSFPRVY